MNQPVFRVLLVEDNPTDALLAQDELESTSRALFKVVAVVRLQAALEQLASQSFDAALLDLNLPDSEGLDTFKRVAAQAPLLPVLVLSHHADEQLALDAVQAGAQDYLVKGQAQGVLVRAVRYAIERSRSEQALLASESSLARAQADAKIGSWQRNLVNRTVNWSAEMYRLFGRDPELGPPNFEIFVGYLHPDDRREFVRISRQSIAERRPRYSLDFRIPQPDGSMCWVEARSELVLDANGQPAALRGTAQDITDRKWLEETLRFLAQSSGVGDEAGFFRPLARFLAGALHADYICIDRLVDNTLKAQTLAVWCDGKFDDNLEYHLQDTPCGAVVGQQVCVFPSGVRDKFPNDAALQVLQAEGYVGVTLWSSAGKPIGLIAAISRRPLGNLLQTEAVLKLVAVRGASELERESALLALRESEARWQFALQGADDGVWDWNYLAGTAYFSPRWKSMLGHTDAEIGSSVDEWVKRVHPDDLPGVMAIMQDHIHGKTASAVIDHRMLCKDGRWIWVVGRGMVISRDVAGKPLRIVGTNRDITERKLLETQSQRAAARNAMILVTALDGFWLVKPDGQLCDVNARACEMLGYTREEMLALHVGDVDVRDAPEVVAARIREIELTGGIRFESRHRCKDGRILDVELSARQLREEGLIAVFVHDITQRKQAEQSLAQSEQRFRDMVNTTDGIVWEADAQTFCFTFISRKAEELLGFTTQEWLEPGFWVEHLHPEDKSWAPQYCASCTGRLEPHNFDYRFVAKNGHTVWLQDIVTVVAEQGVPRWLRGIMIDITERKSAEAKLQLAASVFTHAREGIMITDAAGTIMEVNDTFTAITGYSREEAVGQNPRILKSGLQPPDYYATLWQALTDIGHWTSEVWNRRKNGEVFAEMQTISAVRDDNGITRNYVSLFTDITAMKAQQQRLEHIAHYDALTNLPNRVLLADRLQQAMLQSQRRGKALAVVYLDLDGFKQVNDQHGHGVGDTLLIAVSQQIKDALREGDTLARIGGDEFVAVLVDLDGASDCEPVLARLLQSAAQSVTIGKVQLQVSASIGVTLYPQDGVDADLLLRHADQAMYIAKEAGKNRYHFFDVQSAAAVRSQRENLNGIALALEHQQFVLHYQPKVNMRAGVVVGAEALIRWQHPQRGLLPPGAFLSAIDNHPLSIAVGEWVISSALAQMAAWSAQGLELPVSVNIDALQLQQIGFVGRLEEMLQAHPEIPPHRLQLEVLETSALDDMGRVSEAMQACQSLGVQFALDDFGTGYSSLTYLRRLPAQMLKIDQSFVRDMLVDPGDLAIVQGVISLASTFGRSVIAEGVETQAHGKRLLEMQCELAQGYGIARPMPAADLPKWVHRWTVQEDWTA